MASSGKGLEGVVAAETALSDIDGKKGVLYYVGYDIHDLVNASFEEVTYLLHHLELPNGRQLEDIQESIANEREPNELVVRLMEYVATDTVPMAMLRTAVSLSSARDPDRHDMSEEANYRKAMRLLGVFPTLIAYFDAVRSERPLVPPDPALSQAANFLYMLQGDKADDEAARVLDICLVLHADHTMNASTFAARVCAATLSDMHSAITAAIAALKGPLHGGANEAVMGMLKEIREPSKARSYIHDMLQNKKKIMGFGHRVYKTEDPRATHLRRISKDLAEKTGDSTYFEISQEIEKAVMDEKGLYPNVDFYAASVYGSLGIPTDLFTPLFACSRVAGWTAHVREQYADNRLIRPDHAYVGPEPRAWIPIPDR